MCAGFRELLRDGLQWKREGLDVNAIMDRHTLTAPQIFCNPYQDAAMPKLNRASSAAGSHAAEEEAGHGSRQAAERRNQCT